MSHTREYIHCGEGTVIEYDREYMSGELTSIIYHTSDKQCHEIVITKEDVDHNLFLFSLRNEVKKFDITSQMIEDSKKSGPFLIEGESRIVEI